MWERGGEVPAVPRSAPSCSRHRHDVVPFLYAPPHGCTAEAGPRGPSSTSSSRSKQSQGRACCAGRSGFVLRFILNPPHMRGLHVASVEARAVRAREPSLANSGLARRGGLRSLVGGGECVTTRHCLQHVPGACILSACIEKCGVCVEVGCRLRGYTPCEAGSRRRYCRHFLRARFLCYCCYLVHSVVSFDDPEKRRVIPSENQKWPYSQL